MSIVQPTARLGVILFSGNRPLEPYFRALAPEQLAIHITRMQMGSGGQRARDEIQFDAVRSAELLAEAKVDVIDLQATGIMMERGPAGEAEVVKAITAATGIPAYTATQAVMEAMRALGIKRVIQVNPGSDAAIGREKSYLEAAGFSVVHSVGLDSGRETFEVEPAAWLEAAKSNDRPDGDGFFLSGSNTRMLEAIADIEQATGKPAVTSIQAALWAGVQRLAPQLGAVHSPPDLGRLFAIA